MSSQHQQHATRASALHYTQVKNAHVVHAVDVAIVKIMKDKNSSGDEIANVNFF